MGIIRPQDKWLRTKEFKEAHAAYAEQLRADIAQCDTELAQLKQRRAKLRDIVREQAGGRSVGDAPDTPEHQELRAVRRREAELRVMRDDADDLLRSLQDPTWEMLTDYFAETL